MGEFAGVMAAEDAQLPWAVSDAGLVFGRNLLLHATDVAVSLCDNCRLASNQANVHRLAQSSLVDGKCCGSLGSICGSVLNSYPWCWIPREDLIQATLHIRIL